MATGPGPTPSPNPSDPRMRGFRARTSVDEVLAAIAGRVERLETEVVSLHEAAGRVLACKIQAEAPVPAFDRAAMDGYAVRGEETFGATPYSPALFRCVGEARPGRP